MAKQRTRRIAEATVKTYRDSKRIQQSATGAYFEKRDAIGAQLTRIRALLKRTGKRVQWDTVGSLAHVQTQLDEAERTLDEMQPGRLRPTKVYDALG